MVTLAFFFLVAGAMLAAACTPAAEKVALHLNIVAHPNTDVATHTRVVPLLGGCGIFAAVLAAGIHLLSMNVRWAGFIAAITVAFLFGAYKDKIQKPVNPWIQIMFQTAALVCLIGVGFHVHIFGQPFPDGACTVFLGLWIINGINFLDIMDGLAAGLTAIISLFFGIIALANQQQEAILLAAALSGGCAGFLAFNRPPARIFMGDIGSFIIGVSLTALFLKSQSIETDYHDLAGSLLLLCVPLAEVLATSLVRVLKGRLPTMGGGEHIPLQLLNKGWKPVSVLAVSYGFCFLCGIMGCFIVLSARH